MEVRRWKAFLRLEGESIVEREEDIMNEFKGFVQTLKRVGIDYSIIVNVEKGKLEATSRPKQAASMAHAPLREKGTERVGG